MKIKLIASSVSLILLSALTFGLMVTPVMAATQANSAMTLTQTVETDRQGNESIVLNAKLTRADGYPLSERNVSFFETVNLFGTARISLGSAVTSAVGIASLTYDTRQPGEHQFTAVYGGDDITTSSIVNATFDLENLPAMPPLYPPTGMESITRWTLPVVGLVVLAVWSLLLGVVVYVVRGIRKGTRQVGV